MSHERLRTTPFETGHYAQKETTEPVDKYANRPSMKHDGDLNDPLRKALSIHKAILPRDNHRWTHSKTPQARGAHYHPAQAFGAMERTGAGRGVYSYGGNRHSAVPGNAVGSPPERHGDNAVGHPPHRRGTNAVPGRQNTRGGTNAVGHAPNRIGENALASRFVPRGGGRQP